MKRATLLTLAAVALFAAASRLTAQAAPAATPAAGLSALRGIVIDSLHEAPLAHASVMVDGTNRMGVTNADGQYQIDSIPPGKHKVVVLHPLFDTLGVTMRTPDYTFVAGQTHDLDVPVP